MVNRFGTRPEMIIQPIEEAGVNHLLAIDTKGLYITNEQFVGNRQADPNRYSDRSGVASRLEALGLSPAELFEQNKHLAQEGAGDGKKKLNPMKASKRKK